MTRTVGGHWNPIGWESSLHGGESQVTRISNVRVPALAATMQEPRVQALGIALRHFGGQERGGEGSRRPSRVCLEVSA